MTQKRKEAEGRRSRMTHDRYVGSRTSVRNGDAAAARESALSRPRREKDSSSALSAVFLPILQ